MSPDLDTIERRGASSVIGTPLRMLTLCAVSLVVMTPWPLLGVLLTRSMFDEPSEAILLFGGITLFPLMVLAFFSVSKAVYAALIVLVWLTAALVPGLWLGRRRITRTRVVVMLMAQMVFSLAQAAMGALLVLGKGA